MSFSQNLFWRRSVSTTLSPIWHGQNLRISLLWTCFALSLLARLGAFTLPAHAEVIRVAGSSTVYPFAAVIAEQVGRKTGSALIIEATGSGAGMRSVCQQDADIGNMSRRIKASELEKCMKNGVDIVEFLVGRDGIIFAVSAKNTNLYTLSLQDIYLALARDIPVNGQMKANPHQRWNDVNPALPDSKILVYGPPPTSGTRDALESLALVEGAKTIAMLADLRTKDNRAFLKIAQTIRDDGAYVEGGENDNLLIRKLQNEPSAIAIFGFSYLDNNRNIIRGLNVNDVAPDFENILDSSYPVSRPLYFYVRKTRFDAANGYINEFMGLNAIGEEGYLLDKGLIPLTDSEYRAEAAKLNSQKSLTLDMLR